MLQQIRTHTGSYLVKILFAILVGSFAIWGIGDVVRQITSPDRPAIVAGDASITSAEVGRQFQNELTRLRRQFGPRFTAEQAVQLGVLDQAVDTLVTDRLLDQEARRLGLEVGPELIRDRLRSEPGFKDSAGAFSARAFDMWLRNLGLSEQEYLRILRQEIEVTLIAGAIFSGATVPKPLTIALERFRGERRIGETVTVRHAAMTSVPEPTDAELAAYHKDQAARFTTPEYRRGSLLRLAVEDLAATAQTSDAAIQEEYERRSGDFQTPERLQLLQALVTDEADARKLADAAKAGDFVDLAKDIAKLDADSLKLGTLAKLELPPELGEPVFATPEGGVTSPIKSSLGWHVFKVEAVLPATAKSLDEVREEIRSELAKEAAQDMIARVSVKLEDEVVGGGNLEEASQKLNLKIVSVDPVDQAGNGPDGKPVVLPNTDTARLLKTLFETASGKTSTMIETERGDFFVVRTEEIRPAAVTPLDQIKEKVAAAWLAEKQRAAAKAKAADILAKARGGDLAVAVAAEGLSVETTPPVLRSGNRGENMPAPPVVAAMFQIKKGEVAQASTADAEVVVKVKDVQPSEAAETETRQQAIERELRNAMLQDMQVSFTQGLRQRYPVRIDQAQIDKLK